ncbi:MAG: DMT family transporter [Deltaproteobacteria bacterium]|jgi:drug/metabolite transporter (DMT)-like permease|nr:DMT family transporter [Deltaproteobacteria bacterium]
MEDQKLQIALDRHQLSHAKKGLGFALISGLLWAASGTALYTASLKDPFTQASEMVGLIIAASLSLAMIHDAAASILVFIFNAINGKSKEFFRTLRTRPGKIVCLGAIMGGPVGMSGSLLGITMAGSTYAMPITATYPALAAIFSTIFLKEKNPPRVWVGILLCIAGALIIGYTPTDETMSPNFKLGIALSCLATIGWATEGVVSTYGMDTLDPDVVLSIRELTSTVVFGVIVMPIMAVSGIMGSIPGWDITIAAFKTPVVLVAALAGLFGGTSYILWYRALNSTGVARAMALNICYALWSVIMGVLLTDQELTRQSLMGAATIVVGALLVVANPRELFSLRKV